MKVFLCTVLLVGCTFAAPDLRIVGGQDATPNEFPYMISLQRIEVVQDGSKHFCGGSIISDRWILTAAHCVDGSRFIEDTQIMAGAHSLTVPNNHEQLKHPKRIVKHPKYRGSPGSFDIALVELSQPLDFNEFVNKVKIPVDDPYYPSGAGIVSSWGSTSNTGIPEYPDILQKAVIPIVPALSCYTSQASDDLKIHLTDFCAGSHDSGKSICLDDYGSPFVQRNIHGEFIQVGVVGASSTPCGLVDKKGIFVNVSFFLEWIHNTIGSKIGC